MFYNTNMAFIIKHNSYHKNKICQFILTVTFKAVKPFPVLNITASSICVLYTRTK